MIPLLTDKNVSGPIETADFESRSNTKKSLGLHKISARFVVIAFTFFLLDFNFSIFSKMSANYFWNHWKTEMWSKRTISLHRHLTQLWILAVIAFQLLVRFWSQFYNGFEKKIADIFENYAQCRTLIQKNANLFY